MATSTINDQLVFRVDTNAGETTVTITIPRQCKISDMVSIARAGSTLPTNSANVVVNRIRASVSQRVTDSLVINDIQPPLGDSAVGRLKGIYPAGTDLLAGDQLEFVKDDPTVLASIFVYADAPGAGLLTSAV